MLNFERSVADGMRASTDARTVQNAVHTCQRSSRGTSAQRAACTESTLMVAGPPQGCVRQTPPPV